MAPLSFDRSAVRIFKDNVRVSLRLTPKASKNGITGIAQDADGGEFIKASVTTVAEAGKANAQLIKILSNEWGVAKSSLEIVQGRANRRKVVEISGDAPTVERKLAAWMKTLSGKSNG